LIPLVGTMAYFILVHRTLLEAEKPGAAQLGGVGPAARAPTKRMCL